jgi:hypothetical protein
MAEPREQQRSPYAHERFELDDPDRRTPWWRRSRALLLGAALLIVLAIIIGIAAHDDDSSSSSPAPTRSADASIAQRTGANAAAARKRMHPFKGVTLSGSAAGRLHLVAFRARTIADMFSPIIRIHNDSRDLDANLVAVKVVVLKHGEPVATANGVIEHIPAGKTVTTEPISADEWTEAKGYTFDVQLDDE